MGLVPDRVIRAGIRRLNRQRLEDIHADDIELSALNLSAFVADMITAEIAPVPDLANEQHYELPARFFETVLGPWLKYSSCLWSDGVDNLAAAEERMLALSCERAGLCDGIVHDDVIGIAGIDQ